MTRYEKLFTLPRLSANDDLAAVIQSGLCPGDFGIGPNIDIIEGNVDDEQNLIGCRGITCHECWNKEVS